MAILKKALLAVSIVLIMIGMGLTFGGVFSPAWQVVDIREFRVEHQHGLWWDCVREEIHVVAVGDFYEEAPLHCMYKFDDSAAMVIQNSIDGVDQDGAAGESEHHMFWGWHKAVLTFFVLSFILAFTALCTACCTPCFAPCTFVFTISLFLSMVCSVLVDGIFFFSANRVDIRFVQGMVGTYEQQIGYAFYLHLLGTGALVGAFVCALLTTYKFFQSSGNSDDNDISADADNFQQRQPFLRTYNNDKNGYQKQEQQQKAPTAYQYQQRTTYRETSA